MLKSIKEGQDVEFHSKRPSASKSEDHVTHVPDILNTDHQMGMRMIAKTLNITKTIVHNIVNDIFKHLQPYS